MEYADKPKDADIFSSELSDEEGELVCIYCRQESNDFSILGENDDGELDGSIDSVSGPDVRLNRKSLVCHRDECMEKLYVEAKSLQGSIESGEESVSSSDSDDSDSDSTSDSSDEESEKEPRKKKTSRGLRSVSASSSAAFVASSDSTSDSSEEYSEEETRKKKNPKKKRSSSSAGKVSSSSAPRKRSRQSQLVPEAEDEDEDDSKKQPTFASGASRNKEKRAAEKREERLATRIAKDGLVSSVGLHGASNIFMKNSPHLAQVTEVFSRDDLYGVIPNLKKAKEMNGGVPARDVADAMSILTRRKTIKIGSTDLTDDLKNVTTFENAHQSSSEHPVRVLLSIHSREGDKMTSFAEN